MKKTAYFIISGIIGFLIFAFVLQIIGLEDLVVPLKNFSLLYLALYLVISLLILLTITIRWGVILKAHGYRVDFSKLILLMLSGKAVSYLTPSAQVGGEALRAYLLSREKIPVSKGLSSIIVDKALDITSNSMFAVLALPVMIMFFPLSIYIKWGLGLLLAVMILAIFLFYFQSMRGKQFFIHIFRFLRLHKIKKIKSAEKGLEKTEKNISYFFRHNKGTFRFAVFYSVLTWLLMFLEFKLVLLTFGYNPTPIQAILALAMVGFAYIVPIPAALGVLEASEASLFALFGVNPAIGIAMSFLTRARDMFWAAIGIVYISSQGIKVAKEVAKS